MPAKWICGGRTAGVLNGDFGGLIGLTGGRGRVAEERLGLELAPRVGFLEGIDLCRGLDGVLAHAGVVQRPNAPGQPGTGTILRHYATGANRGQ